MYSIDGIGFILGFVPRTRSWVVLDMCTYKELQLPWWLMLISLASTFRVYGEMHYFDSPKV